MNTSAIEMSPEVSRDGRWIAYESNQSGSHEVVRAAIPGRGTFAADYDRWRMYPRWSRDGRELFFWTGTALGVVSVEAADEFRHGNPRELFKTTFAVVSPLGAVRRGARRSAFRLHP